MKNIVAALILFATMLLLNSQPAIAGGGQITGEKGEGLVAQNGPTPFGGDTPAGPQADN